MAFLVIALAGAAASPASASAPHRCPDPLRIAILDLDESSRTSQSAGMTALQRAIAQRISETAVVPARIRAYPYARALRSFRDGVADAILVADGGGRDAVPDATRVPMMRLLFVRFGVANRQGMPAAADLGMLNGMIPPPGSVQADEEVQFLTNYDALLRQLLGGRVNEILGVRPSVDAFLAVHPTVLDQLSPMRLVAEQAMTWHLHPSLDPACRAHLAATAKTVAERDLGGIFRQTVPGVRVAPFLLTPAEDAATASSR